MTTSSRIAEIAALLGDPTRAGMLAALIGGRALAAGELTDLAGVTPSTASGHLAKLTAAGLLTCVSQGRHRYYRLASIELAQLLEGLMVFAESGPSPPRATPRIPTPLRMARTCYDHLAGRLGVALADALEGFGAVRLSDGAGTVTDSGHAFLAKLGIDLTQAAPTRRPECRPCLDWSERRPHLAGRLGVALLDRTLELGWIEHATEPRVVHITPNGERGFADTFGIRL